MSSRCTACSGCYRPIHGDGPQPAQFLLIGERPGVNENKMGQVFVGASGKELDKTYLRLAGLRRGNCRVVNSVLCWAEGNRKPSEKEFAACSAHHLPYELDRTEPEFVLLLGATACKLVPDIDLELEHGIPRQARIFDWEGTVVPMYHPAAGMHDTGTMIPLLEDFARFASVWRGAWYAKINPHPYPDYRLLTTESEVYNSLASQSTNRNRMGLIAMDTERHGNMPWSVQYSITPGTGYMIRTDPGQRVIDRLLNEDPTQYLADLIRAGSLQVVLHAAAQDLDWLDRMGLTKLVVAHDTMQEAYHLGSLPQGLKALAYRLLSIRMTSYDEVVVPHSRQALKYWMQDALVHAISALQRIEHKQLKTKVKEIRKPGDEERALKRIITHADANVAYDPWDKLAEAGLDSWESVLAECGPPPIKGIGNVPENEQVAYACADADMTLRVELELQSIRAQLAATTHNIDDSDRDP